MTPSGSTVRGGRYSQPVPLEFLVEPLHVRVRLPPTPAAEQVPSQVTLQVPPLQVMLELVPAVMVHDLPAQLMLQLLPHEPVQVESVEQFIEQLSVVEVQPSKLQVEPDGHAQAVPAQYEPQPDSAAADTARQTARTRSMGNSFGLGETAGGGR